MSLPTHLNHWLPHQPEYEKLHPACHTAVRDKHKALKGMLALGNAGYGQLGAFRGNVQGYRDLTIKEQFLSGTRTLPGPYTSWIWSTRLSAFSTVTSFMESFKAPTPAWYALKT